MLRIIFASITFVVAVFLTHASQAKFLAEYDVKGWSIIAYQSDDTGKFSFCSALAPYKSGITLRFSVYNDLNWSMGFTSDDFRLKVGSKVDVRFRVDNKKIYDEYARVIGKDFMLIDLGQDSNLFQDMIDGQLLNVLIMGRRVGFRLDGTAAMLRSLLDCAVHYTRAAAAEPPAAEPSRTAPPKQKSSAGAPDEARGTISTGSGFFISVDGVGVTNAHVVKGCQSATVAGYGPARILARDTTNDLALIRLGGAASTPTAKLRSKPIQLGETVYVMGFPLAGQLDNGLNFTSGLVSSLAGVGNDTRAIQFTAPIQLGNSGGPIVDNSGLVVGVTRAKLDDLAALEKSGSIPQNVNFGIKADLVSNFLRANGTEPIVATSDPQRDAPAIASEGRGYTFQIKCTVE